MPEPEPGELPELVLLEAPVLSDAELAARIGDEVAEDDVYSSTMMATLVSADGSVIMGSAGHHWERVPLQRSFDWGSAARWTAATGSQGIGRPGVADEAVAISADGNVAVLRGRAADNHESQFRWTAAGGLEDLSDPNWVLQLISYPAGYSYEATTINGASADGIAIVAVGYQGASEHTEAALWQVGKGWQSLGASEYPEPIEMNRDGSVILTSSETMWRAGQPALAVPPGCHASGVSPDGAMIGGCFSTVPGETSGPAPAFHMTKQGEVTRFEGTDVEYGPALISDDGKVVLLVVYGFNEPTYYVRWTRANGLEPLTGLGDAEQQGQRGKLISMDSSADGSSFTFNYEDEEQSAWYPVRWSVAKGREDLTPPDGYEHSRALVTSTDGTLTAGFAFNGSYYYTQQFGEGGVSRLTDGSVVVWDAQGPRDLSVELAEQGFDVSALVDGRPFFVAHTGDVIVVVGNSAAGHGWRARIRAR